MDRAVKNSDIDDRVTAANAEDRATLRSEGQGTASAVPSGDAIVINVAPEIATPLSRDTQGPFRAV